jgi:hypothetical protein
MGDTIQVNGGHSAPQGTRGGQKAKEGQFGDKGLSSAPGISPDRIQARLGSWISGSNPLTSRWTVIAEIATPVTSNIIVNYLKFFCNYSTNCCSLVLWVTNPIIIVYHFSICNFPITFPLRSRTNKPPRVRTYKGKINKEKGRNSVKGQKMELIREKALGQIKRYFLKARGSPRGDDRRIISGIVYVLRNRLK